MRWRQKAWRSLERAPSATRHCYRMEKASISRQRTTCSRCALCCSSGRRVVTVVTERPVVQAGRLEAVAICQGLGAWLRRLSCLCLCLSLQPRLFCLWRWPLQNRGQLRPLVPTLVLAEVLLPCRKEDAVKRDTRTTPLPSGTTAADGRRDWGKTGALSSSPPPLRLYLGQWRARRSNRGRLGREAGHGRLGQGGRLRLGLRLGLRHALRLGVLGVLRHPELLPCQWVSHRRPRCLRIRGACGAILFVMLLHPLVRRGPGHACCVHV